MSRRFLVLLQGDFCYEKKTDVSLKCAFKFFFCCSFLIFPPSTFCRRCGISGTPPQPLLTFFFFFIIFRRRGKNKALAHHTFTYLHTRRNPTKTDQPRTNQTHTPSTNQGQQRGNNADTAYTYRLDNVLVIYYCRQESRRLRDNRLV